MSQGYLRSLYLKIVERIEELPGRFGLDPRQKSAQLFSENFRPFHHKNPNVYVATHQATPLRHF